MKPSFVCFRRFPRRCRYVGGLMELKQQQLEVEVEKKENILIESPQELRYSESASIPIIKNNKIIEASALTQRILERHRQRQQSLDTHLYPSINNLSNTCEDKETKTLLSIQMRITHGKESVRFSRKCNALYTTPFTSKVLERYTSVGLSEQGNNNNNINMNNNKISPAAYSWKINMPTTLSQAQTLRGVIAQREKSAQRQEWERVRECQQLSSMNNNNNNNNNTIVSGQTSVNSIPSPILRRYCLQFGSNTLGQAPFLTDPTTYYVLSNLQLKGNETLMGVRYRAKELRQRYECTQQSL